MAVKKPKIVFLENVKNLVGHDNGNTFRVIIECLEAEGYERNPKNRKEAIKIHGCRCQICGFD